MSSGLKHVTAPLTSEDRIAASRLNGLLDYVEALVKLDERIVTRLTQHKLADGSQFIRHEHELAGLPGVTLDSSDTDGAVWLGMQRLQRMAAPSVGKEIAEWIEVSNDPTRSPAIRTTKTAQFAVTITSTAGAPGHAPGRRKPWSHWRRANASA
jgi:hypothetical protein